MRYSLSVRLTCLTPTPRPSALRSIFFSKDWRAISTPRPLRALLILKWRQADVYPAPEITVNGTSANGQKSETHQIRARFIAKGTHAYQVAIVSTKAPPPDQIDQFFSSFKLF